MQIIMKTNNLKKEETMRVKLIMPTYEGNSQLLDVMRHIDDTVTVVDGLYTQLALILIGDIQEAYEYERDARAFLKEYYYTAIRAVSYKQIGEDQYINSFSHYPFASLFNPLLQFNRRVLGKYPVSVQALTLASISMGSINIDLLGLGKILDFIEHTVKQVLWEARHEKEMAMQSRLRASLEEQLLGEKIIEAHLANEEKRLYLASKKIELFDVIQKLDFPLKQKRQLVKSIVDKIDLVSLMAEIKLINEQLPSTLVAKKQAPDFHHKKHSPKSKSTKEKLQRSD